MKCPHCGGEINVGSLLGRVKSEAKAKASKENAKLGGWPKGKKRGPRKPTDANALAHSIVAEAEKLTLHAGKSLPPQRSKVLPFPKGSKRGRSGQPPSRG